MAFETLSFLNSEMCKKDFCLTHDCWNSKFHLKKYSELTVFLTEDSYVLVL